VPSRSPATIVVLEENAAARELIERTLREAGNRVLVTNDPYEALELARRVRIDLLVAALDRAQQTFLQRLRSLEGSLRVLYLVNRDESVLAEADGRMTLNVPFSLEELLEAVDTSLGR